MLDSDSIPAASTEDVADSREKPGLAQEAVRDAVRLPELDPVGRSGVYAIMGVPGWVKIGKARDITKRMFDLQTGHPVPLRLIAVLSTNMSFEGLLHARFRHLRGSGEWFRLTDELLRVITGQEHPFAEQLKHTQERERAERRERRLRFIEEARERAAAERARAEKKQANAKRRKRRGLALDPCEAPPQLNDIRAWLAARRGDSAAELATPTPRHAGERGR